MRSPPPILSGGQQQRVAIARAVITKPTILFADEPTGNVDDHIANKIMHLFRELNKMGTTVVIATHNEMMVNATDLTVMKLENGKLTISAATN